MFISRELSQFEADMMLRYQRYVRFLVKKYVERLPYPIQPADREDLWQEGMIGLLGAIRTFDAEHASGAAFTTYAANPIMREVRRAERQKRHVIRIPDDKHDALARIVRVLKRPDAHQLTDAEMAEAADVTLKTYQSLKCSEALKSQLVFSVQPRTNAHDESNDLEQRGAVEPDGGIRPDEEFERAEAALHNERLIKDMISSLADDEQKTIIRMKLGWDGGEPANLPEISRRIGKPVEEVRKQERKALSRMTTFARRRNLKPF